MRITAAEVGGVWSHLQLLQLAFPAGHLLCSTYQGECDAAEAGAATAALPVIPPL
jgi:hypothetical protein